MGGALLLCLILCHCGAARKTDLASSPEAEMQRGALRAEGGTLATLKAMGRIKVRQEGSLTSFRAVWVGKRPDRFRMEILAVTGQPVISFASNGENYDIYSYQDGKHYRAAASESNLSRFLPVSLTPGEIFDLLIGRFPLSPTGTARIEKSAGGAEVLVVTDRKRGIMDRVPVGEAPGKTMARFDLGGNLLFSLSMEKIREMDGNFLPGVVTLTDAEGILLQFAADRYWVNEPVSEDRFVLEAP